MSSPDPLNEVAQFRTSIQGQMASLRDTAKWLAGGVSVAAAGLVAGGALASFGSLASGKRMGVAIAGGLVALIALGAILSRALDVLTARRLPLSAFFNEQVVPRSEREVLQKALADLFPQLAADGAKRIENFPTLEREMANVREAVNSDDPAIQRQGVADAAQLNQDLAFFVPAATFEELRYRFLSLRRRVLAGGTCVILGLAAFVWAVNPPKDPALLGRPTLLTVAVDPADQGALDKGWVNSACAKQTSLAVLVVRRHASGVEDLVTVPTAVCQESVRLERREGRLFTSDNS